MLTVFMGGGAVWFARGMVADDVRVQAVCRALVRRQVVFSVA